MRLLASVMRWALLSAPALSPVAACAHAIIHSAELRSDAFVMFAAVPSASAMDRAAASSSPAFPCASAIEASTRARSFASVMPRATRSASDSVRRAASRPTSPSFAGRAVAPAWRCTLADSASSRPVAVLPRAACQWLIALRVRGPNSPSGGPGSNPSTRRPAWICLRSVRSRPSAASTSSADGVVPGVGYAVSTGTHSAASTSSVLPAWNDVRGRACMGFSPVVLGCPCPVLILLRLSDPGPAGSFSLLPAVSSPVSPAGAGVAGAAAA